MEEKVDSMSIRDSNPGCHSDNYGYKPLHKVGFNEHMCLCKYLTQNTLKSGGICWGSTGTEIKKINLKPKYIQAR